MSVSLRPFLGLFCFLLLVPSLVTAQVDFSTSRSFGDSITANDNVHLYFPPELGLDPTIYGADPFEATFNKSAASDDTLTNFAVPGATSGQVLLVVKGYVTSRQLNLVSPATLVSLQAGGNDFFTAENLAILGTARPGENDEADAIVDRVKHNLMTAVTLLRKVDSPQIVLWTVPDVTLTPYFASFGLSDEMTENVRLHIARLNHFIRTQGNRRDIAICDLARVLLDVTITPPVIAGVPLTPPPAFGFASALLADPIHPTAVGNAIIANEMIDQLNQNFDSDLTSFTEAELAMLAGIN